MKIPEIAKSMNYSILKTTTSHHYQYNATMKKIILILTLFISAVSIFGQNSRTYRQMVEIRDVPKNVRGDFNLRYPNAFVKMWYVTSITYWYEDYGPSYYNSWYRPRTMVVYKFDQPSYYEVEFMRNDENSRAIFNRYGNWFETRTKVNNLPQKIVDALEDSDFSGWKISEYKERIEAPGMVNSVFRMHVSKEHLSQIIRISEIGKIVQIKME